MVRVFKNVNSIFLIIVCFDRSFIRYNDPTAKLCNTDVDRLLNVPEPVGIFGKWLKYLFVSSYMWIINKIPIIDGEHLALKVEFTLGTSQYATMALREIMRAETSSQAQSSITHN